MCGRGATRESRSLRQGCAGEDGYLISRKGFIGNLKLQMESLFQRETHQRGAANGEVYPKIVLAVIVMLFI